MTVPRSVADVLADHVRLEVESIDRMYCNLYVPQLQHVNGVVRFFRGHRGMPFASSALMDPISKTFVAGIHRYCRDHGVPMVDFVRGQRKDDLAQEYLARFTGEEGVLFVGRAQEKTRVFRTEKRRNRDTGATYPWIVSSTGVVNHFYVYAVDADFGMFFIKFSSYFPYTAKLCINGNEYAKRVAARAGIGFTALDNGFATCEDPAAVQAICDRLSPAKIDALVRKWLRRLPHPFTAADRAAGYRYDISILQAEFCLTQVLDRPATGRVFGRRIITKGRRKTPGRFRTRVLTAGVTQSLHIDYKNTKVKQYHKLDQALRTETTINDSRDFGIGKRLCNLPALREVGFSANRRLLAVQRLSHDPSIGATAITSLTSPTTGSPHASPEPTATPSPTTDCTWPCSSPATTPECSAPASATSSTKPPYPPRSNANSNGSPPPRTTTPENKDFSPGLDSRRQVHELKPSSRDGHQPVKETHIWEGT